MRNHGGVSVFAAAGKRVEICTQVRQAERGLLKVAPVVTDNLPPAIQGFAH